MCTLIGWHQSWRACIDQEILANAGSISQGLHATNVVCVHQKRDGGQRHASSSKECMYYMWCVFIGWATLTSPNGMHPQPMLVCFRKEMSTNGRQHQPTIASMWYSICASSQWHSLLEYNISKACMHRSWRLCIILETFGSTNIWKYCSMLMRFG